MRPAPGVRFQIGVRLIAVGVAISCVGAGAAWAVGPGTMLPVAPLTVSATIGGEPADVELRADGTVTLRLSLARDGKLIARVVGATLVATDGRVFASLGPHGRLTARGFDKPMRLRGCSLDDGMEGETTLRPNGEFFLKPPGQKRFPLPAAVRGDFKRACPTASFCIGCSRSSPSVSSDAVDDFHCSFCGKRRLEVRKLIAGPRVFICDECVTICVDAIAKEKAAASNDLGPDAEDGEKGSKESQPSCRFCGKSQHDVKYLIAGPTTVFICDGCVGIAVEIVEEENAARKPPA